MPSAAGGASEAIEAASASAKPRQRWGDLSAPKIVTGSGSCSGSRSFTSGDKKGSRALATARVELRVPPKLDRQQARGGGEVGCIVLLRIVKQRASRRRMM
jgi:hypothetical protein